MRAGEIELALGVCERVGSPVARVVRDGLRAAGASAGQLESVLAAAVLRERPGVEGPTRYLPVLANLGVLCGLLGTLTGLVLGFSYVGGGGSVDPGRKAMLLACGIAEAMNCTAFGLLVAIVGLSVHGLIKGRTQRLLAALDDAAMRTRNLLVEEYRDLGGEWRPHGDTPRD